MPGMREKKNNTIIDKGQKFFILINKFTLFEFIIYQFFLAFEAFASWHRVESSILPRAN